jgi:hypothetical protein
MYCLRIIKLWLIVQLFIETKLYKSGRSLTPVPIDNQANLAGKIENFFDGIMFLDSSGIDPPKEGEKEDQSPH